VDAFNQGVRGEHLQCAAGWHRHRGIVADADHEVALGFAESLPYSLYQAALAEISNRR
jgi:hypothetical protein